MLDFHLQHLTHRVEATNSENKEVPEPCLSNDLKQPMEERVCLSTFSKPWQKLMLLRV